MKKPRQISAFPIVGIGASAGGLEALEQFMSHVPSDCGIAFIVVQHLDPKLKGILVELLQRRTPLSVIQVRDGMKVEPNHIYVIPPNADLSILRGTLHLLEPTAPRGLHLPIDFFFRSLADDQLEESIGVILSGMGSDGSQGLRAIKEKLGATFVQSPASAKFDSMPGSAIEADMADVVADPEVLPLEIMNYVKGAFLRNRPNTQIVEKQQNAIDKVLILLRNQTGHDFSLYKKSTLSRRVERRMGLHKLTSIGNYVRYLRENSQESELLFKELLIGVTSFFRDPSVWEELKAKVIPEMLRQRPPGTTFRAWCTGCSTGEEAYSLAIVFKEALIEHKEEKNFSLQIFGTDLDTDAIDKARAGVFPANIASNMSEERLKRYFLEDERGSFSIKKEIREMVVFAPQNLVMHPPFTRLDFLTCRNLLIYLEVDLQKKLMTLFHYSLLAGGMLILGSSETVGTASDLFEVRSGKLRIYTRLNTVQQLNLTDFPSAFARDRPAALPGPARVSSPNLQSLADQLILQTYAPAAVLVTNEGNILYVSGKTGKYLEPAAGKANWNLFAMSRSGLGNALIEAFHRAVRQKVLVIVKEITVGMSDSKQMVNIAVQPITSPDPLRGLVMVVFTDSPAKLIRTRRLPAKQLEEENSRVTALMQELHQTHDELQATRDEMQTSQEELKSTNEELQSMNEELQSTNEELTTSREEMQSINEEMQTVNHELQAKVEQLSRTSNDIKNLLNSTDIATLFLDPKLIVQRFTTQTSKIINLIPGDVGRPITDIVTSLDYPDLDADIRKVLQNSISIGKDVGSKDKRWFAVRIMPNKTEENAMDGVVITFADITVAKNLESALRQAQSDLEKRFTDQTAQLGNALKKVRK